MKAKLTSYIQWIKENPKKSVVIVIIIGLLVFFFARKSTAQVQSFTVTRGTVTQEVAVSGKTVAVRSVDLGFDKGGRISGQPVAVGEHVKAGTVLASLDNAELQANLAKAKADVDEQNVKLEQAKQQSGDSFIDSRSNLVANIKDAYAKTDDAIRNNIDSFFKNVRQANNYIEFTFKDGTSIYTFPIDTDLRNQINTDRYALELSLVKWKASLAKLSVTSDLNQYSVEAEANLNSAKAFLDEVALAVNSIKSPEYQYEATVTGYKTTVSTARTEVSTAFSNFNTAKAKFSTSPKVISGVNNTSQNYDTVLAEEARLAQLEAAVQSIQAQISSTLIISPIDGLVTRQDAKQGQIVGAGEKLVSVISDGNMEIEANISEVNIGKVAIGNTVSITFDAFPGKTYTGKLFYIEPAETIIDNVVNYKVKVSIDGDAKELKSGLTANLKIVTAVAENVLKVPRYAITEENGKTIIKNLVGKKTVPVEVTTGLSGNDESIEVKSGVTEGQQLQVSLTK
jgi:HlyD family secretion protein